MIVKEEFLSKLRPSVQLNSLKAYKEDADNPISVDIKPKAFIPSDSPNTFKIIMDVEIKADDFFHLKVTGVGSFELSKEDVTADTRKTFINANSTAIMFPYMRAFIATLTANIGNVTTPILLPTRFFKGDYIEEANTEE